MRDLHQFLKDEHGQDALPRPVRVREFLQHAHDGGNAHGARRGTRKDARTAAHHRVYHVQFLHAQRDALALVVGYTLDEASRDFSELCLVKDVLEVLKDGRKVFDRQVLNHANKRRNLFEHEVVDVVHELLKRVLETLDDFAFDLGICVRDLRDGL